MALGLGPGTHWLIVTCLGRYLSISQAFCSISTGIYGYPIEDATYIALSEARAFLDADSSVSTTSLHGLSNNTADHDKLTFGTFLKLERVIFVVFPDRDRDVYG
jgi:O-acetyl-ADP-ribose deacetylase